MRVFVAGASGAIGRPLVACLLAAGQEVTGSTRRPSGWGVLGDVGSTIGQQPFPGGSWCAEFQSTHWGWTSGYGQLEVRARMDLSPRSMAAAWMVGLEEPTRPAEICIFEVFGDTLEAEGGGAAEGAVDAV